jgi:hypothetical protein
MNIKKWVVNGFGAIGQFISVLFTKTIHDELAMVLPLAQQAVAQVAADPTLLLPGTKRDVAIASVFAKLAAAQVNIGLSVVSLGIELAVQSHKSSQ